MTLIQTGVHLFALHFGICLMRFGAQSARTQYVVVVLLFMVANDSFKVTPFHSFTGGEIRL